MPKRKRGITGDAASRREAIRKRERKLLKLKKKEAADCPTMAQRGQDRRAEETDEQRNSRLSAMVQHARERRLNVIEGQNQHQIQTFYAARTVLN
ncbi:hypothetical protein AVEN_77506-1 [Araneus ventricosus]|uniref:Uncharacterized protein n=1 Tax=Araneus ventricosus TaxID=182803 RepID=A0A4Y2FPM9_ARAVE|nr:hypothetical protein AVEN_77506-1 [Araneus ventricosus]